MACAKFASTIIKTWAPPRFSYQTYSSKSEIDRSDFSVLLQELDDPEMMRRFLIQIVSKESEIQLGKSFPSFCKRHGWATFQDGLTVVIDAASPATIVRNAALLETLCLQRDKSVDRKKVCTHLAEHAVTALENLDKKRPAHSWEAEKIDRAALMTSLIKSLISIEAAESLNRLVDHTLSKVQKYDLTSAHLAAVFALESRLSPKGSEVDRVVNRWLTTCLAELEKHTVHAPTPPTDFRRASKLSCKCPDCRELSQFLADAHESVHRFPVRKERRRHLHQISESNSCDLTHITSRIGNPQSLVCTKTTASYHKACEIDSRDRENLKRLRAVEAKINRLSRR
jgi:hypothetical protein